MGDIRLSLLRGEFASAVSITVSLGEVVLLCCECVPDQNGAWEAATCGFE